MKKEYRQISVCPEDYETVKSLCVREGYKVTEYIGKLVREEADRIRKEEEHGA